MGENKKLFNEKMQSVNKELEADGGKVARAAKNGLNILTEELNSFKDRIEERAVRLEGRVNALESNEKNLPTIVVDAVNSAVSGMDSRLKKVEGEQSKINETLNAELEVDGAKLSGLQLIAETLRTGKLVIQDWFKRTKEKQVKEEREEAKVDSEQLKKMIREVMKEIGVSSVAAFDGEQVEPEMLEAPEASEVPSDPEIDATVNMLDDADVEIVEESENKELESKLTSLENSLKKAFTQLGYDLGKDEETSMSLDKKAGNIEAGINTLLSDLGYDLSGGEQDEKPKTLAEKIENLEYGLKLIEQEVAKRKSN